MIDIGGNYIRAPKISGFLSDDGTVGTGLAIGLSSVDVTAGDITLTPAQYSNNVLSFVGTPGGTLNATVPLSGDSGSAVLYVVINGCGHAVTLKGASGATVAVANAKTALLLVTATDVLRVTADT